MKKPQVERSGAFLVFGVWAAVRGGVELCSDCRGRCWEGVERGFGLSCPGFPSFFRRENKSVPLFLGFPRESQDFVVFGVQKMGP